LCQCDCKKKVIVLGYSLKNGNTKSCGCLNLETKTKHGQAQNGKRTGIYMSWVNMIQRCTNPNSTHYEDYGGRGIKVCKRWMKPENFIKDMIDNWKPGLTIERKNKNGNYCKKNCKWATRKEQARNTHRNHLITCFGKAQCIAAWSEETGISWYVIRWRITHGWLPEKALTERVRQYKKTELGE